MNESRRCCPLVMIVDPRGRDVGGPWVDSVPCDAVTVARLDHDPSSASVD